MASLSIPHSFTNNTVASATEVNANFASIKSFGESAVVQVDGSVQAGPSAIATNAITNIKILDGAVTSSKIQDGTIALGDLASALINHLVPVGSISAYAGTTAPDGWLLCNGTSTAGYAALASIVGATTPNLAGRTIIGVGTGSGLTARAINNTGGAETHVLTEAQLASHTHIQNEHGHNATPTGSLGGAFSVFGIGPTVGGGSYSTYQVNYTQVDYVSTQNDLKPQNATASNQYTGSGQAHNNMQPYYVLNYIIKH